MTESWIEVNIKPTRRERINEILREFVAPYVEEVKARRSVARWHFFREPEIRLRFSGDQRHIHNIQREPDSRLAELEASRPDIYSEHFFGGHGRRHEVYPGEVDTYGTDVWPLVCELWEAGFELALRVVLTAPEKTICFHAQRHIHLLLNQMGFTRPQELEFHRDMAARYEAEQRH